MGTQWDYEVRIWTWGTPPSSHAAEHLSENEKMYVGFVVFFIYELLNTIKGTHVSIPH